MSEGLIVGIIWLLGTIISTIILNCVMLVNNKETTFQEFLGVLLASIFGWYMVLILTLLVIIKKGFDYICFNLLARNLPLIEVGDELLQMCNFWIDFFS